MANNKTTETTSSVNDFINNVHDEAKRNDCFILIDLIKEITELEPKMWGPSIVGFGSHHYKYESGREGDSPNIAFSPRSSSIAIYLSANFDNREALLNQFGKHKADKGCVHIKSMSDINLDVLKTMITNHLRHVSSLYPKG
ncbi:MAG: DUF1801 domain-containing protein [Saprospiraceae bacterium]